MRHMRMEDTWRRMGDFEAGRRGVRRSEEELSDCQEVPQTEKMEKAKENLISEPKEKVEKLKSAKVWVM